jgi:hypothetical protein
MCMIASPRTVFHPLPSFNRAHEWRYVYSFHSVGSVLMAAKPGVHSRWSPSASAKFRRSYESSPPLWIACGNLTASSASSSGENLTSDVFLFCTSLSLSLVRALIGKMTLPEGSGLGMIVASPAASSHMPSSSRSLWLLDPAINGHWMSLTMNEHYDLLSCSRIPLY